MRVPCRHHGVSYKGRERPWILVTEGSVEPTPVATKGQVYLRCPGPIREQLL